jgi:predicted transcriptional regulator
MYPVSEEQCHEWQEETPQTETTEIAGRDDNPFTLRTVRKHVNGECNHPAPSVDYEACHWWRRYADRDGYDGMTADEIARRDDVPHDEETVRKHMRHECEHSDSLGYPPAPSVEYPRELMDAFFDEHDRDECLNTSASEFRKWAQGYSGE